MVRQIVTSISVFLFFCFALTSCEMAREKSQATSSGSEGDSNGSGYGGQPRFLEQVLERMVLSLNNVREGFHLDSFGKYSQKTCENLGDPILCERLVSTTSIQRQEAIDLLNKFIDDIRALSLKAQMSLVQRELFQMGPKGTKFPVTALAELGGTKIIIDTDAFRAETPAAQVATLTHEFFHLASKELDDFSARGNWQQTRQLLDYLGAATAAHYVDNLGKVVITFPPSNLSCFAPGVLHSLATAPYFVPPTADELKANPEAGGEVSDDAKQFLSSTIKDNDFTIRVWVKIDPEGLADRDANSNGEVIISNMAQGYNRFQLNGLVLYRSSNGNFAAYSGTDVILDSGLPLKADGNYHIVVLRKLKSAGKLSLFVDGVAGAEYSDKYIDEDGNESASSVANSTSATFGIARAGAGPGKCSLNSTTGGKVASLWLCLRPLKGNVASVGIYSEGLPSETVKKLYECGLPIKRTQ